MVSTGDSIARGFDACGLFTDCPNVSYATGTDKRTSSLYSQLLTSTPALRGHQYNDAEVGAHAADLFGQLALAAYQNADVVTVLIDAGADVHATTSDGASALDIARVAGARRRAATGDGAANGDPHHDTVSRLLVAAGATG